MNEQIKAKWLEALTSGEYQQGRNQLKAKDGFCCLGVLCDLHAKETGGMWQTFDPPQYRAADYFGETVVLPQQVMEWAGLEERSPELDEPKRSVNDSFELAEFNDRGFTFSQIADVIKYGF